MTLTTIAFYFFAFAAIGSAAFIAFTKNIVYASFALMSSLISISALYIFSGADFIAITQIMVYVGGILILIVFGVMLTNRISGKALITSVSTQFWGFICGAGVFFIFIYSIFSVNFSSLKWIKNSTYKEEITTVHTLGYGLMSDYILIFELVAILLLTALIGAVILANKKIIENPTNDSN